MIGHWHTPAPLVTHAPGHGGLLASIALCGTEPGRDVLAMSEIRADIDCAVCVGLLAGAA